MPSVLWLTDRSRISDGRGFCARSRYLNYHTGPNGYGMALKATKLPLMTGIGGHEGLGPILEWCRDHDEAIQEGLRAFAAQPQHEQDAQLFLPVPTEVVRAAIAEAQKRYWKVVEKRGFAYLAEDQAVQEVTREQCYLIEGMIWAWCLEVLPEILRRCRIVEVEHDDTYVFACTCGLGNGIGTKEEHEARDCDGIGLQCKPDFLAQVRSTGELEYHDFKTTGLDSITFREKWETMIQMLSAVLDAERRWEKQIQSIYIHGLIKGKREGDYNNDSGKRDGTIRQQSVFCYGYRKPANPPMEQEEWAAQHEWWDDFEQRRRRLGKAFRKTGVWELPDHLVPDGISKAEFWVKWIPPEARRKSLVLIGPLSRQVQMVDKFLTETEMEERRWQAGLWELYDLSLQILETHEADQTADPQVWWELVWPDERFQAALDRLFPRSYECRRYGLRNRCQFEIPCLLREGWTTPVESGMFIERRPHHRDELEQAIGRGLLLPDEGEAEDQDQELPW